MIIGFDFSINKPAACLYQNNKYIFYSWPFDLSEKLKQIYRDAEVNLIDRLDLKYKGKDSSEKMRWEVKNAIYISNQIIGDLLKATDLRQSYIIFEGLSYNSSGNMAINLGGYKYIFMKSLFDEGIPFEKMTTYAPISIKKTAGCSKKGMKKADMINAFIKTGLDIPLRNNLETNPKLFQKRTGTWIEHLDDLVDAFFAVETFKGKNPLSF